MFKIQLTILFAEINIYFLICILKGKEHKNTNEYCLKEFEKLHILKILRFYVFRMSGGSHFELNIETKKYKTHTHLTNVIIIYQIGQDGPSSNYSSF